MKSPSSKKSFHQKPLDRRSCCPVSCSLDIFGDRWTLLIVRDLVLGRSRFKDFIASPEKIPTNILSDRLEKLLKYQIVSQEVIQESPGRKCYRLTSKGEALLPVVQAMKEWGLKWEPGTRVGLKPL
jgi:DNA-binding HxlR family transcriptional regulator